MQESYKLEDLHLIILDDLSESQQIVLFQFLIDNNFSQQQIADSLNVGRRKIEYRFNKYDLKTKNSQKRVHNANITKLELENLIAQDLTKKEIATKLDCSISKISFWLKKYDLKTKLLKEKVSVFFEDGKYWGNCKVHSKTEYKWYSDKYRCIKCVRKKALINSKKKKEAYKDILKQYYQKGCNKCGYNKCSRSLHFHHINPNDKEFILSRGYNKSLERFKKELDKCELLCGNCHRKEEFAKTLIDIYNCNLHNKLDRECRECLKLYRRWYHQQTKLKLINLYNNQCQVCKNSYPLYAYDFHHINPNQKEHAISQLIVNLDYQNLIKEVPKCILVCVNCHAEVEDKIINIPDNVIIPSSEELTKILIKDKIIYNCLDCDSIISNQSKRCKECNTKNSYVFKWPSIEYILKELEIRSYKDLGREIGCSDNAIRKHLISNGVKPPKKQKTI